MEDFQSNKDLSDGIIGQYPRVEHCAFYDKKSAVVDFTQGAKVAGLSVCLIFVKQTHFPFTKNVLNC